MFEVLEDSFTQILGFIFIAPIIQHFIKPSLILGSLIKRYLKIILISIYRPLNLISLSIHFIISQQTSKIARNLFQMANSKFVSHPIVCFLYFFAIHAIYYILTNPVEAGSSICVGGSHTCFVSKSKSLYCWGTNSMYQIGGSNSTLKIGDDPGEMESLKPIATGVNEVTCGLSHTCFTNTNGVSCFGGNFFGSLGLNSSETAVPYNETASKLALPASTVYHVSTHSSLTCASTHNAVYWWGDNNIDSKFFNLPLIADYALSSTPIQLAAGSSHMCYLLANGNAYCLGYNYLGQLGASLTDPSFFKIPKRVDVSQQISAISAGGSHTCVVFLSSSTIACFGQNMFYQLGDGTTKNKGQVPSEMNSLMTTTLLGSGMVYAGQYGTCVVRSADSGVYCIGDNTYRSNCNRAENGPFGSSLSDYPPNYRIQIPLNNSIALAVGYGKHQCATDGTDVYCWGSNNLGQLGIGSTSDLTSCNSTSSFKKACIDGRCAPIKCTTCGVDVNSLIPLFVVLGVLAFLLPIAFFIRHQRRKAFETAKSDPSSALTTSGAPILTKPV